MKVDDKLFSLGNPTTPEPKSEFSKLISIKGVKAPQLCKTETRAHYYIPKPRSNLIIYKKYIL